MSTLRAFGRYLRSTRQSRGYQSARAFALDAGLSDSHVGKFERGEHRPRWKTAQRIMKALKLSPAEREEFKRHWAAAGTPETVQAATVGPAIPGLAVWKHLPEALWKLPHEIAGGPPPVADRALQGIVPAAAAVLGYLAAEDESAEAQLAELDAQVEHIAALEVPFPPNDKAAYALSAGLVERWHRFVFGSQRAASRHARRFASWRYRSGFSTLSEPRVTFKFAGDPPCLATEPPVRAAWLENAYNAMTLAILWKRLDLEARFQSKPHLSYYYLPFGLQRLLSEDPRALRRRLARGDGPFDIQKAHEWLFDFEHAYGAHGDAVFLASLRNFPEYAATCFRDDAPRLEEVAQLAAELRQIIAEEEAKGARARQLD